MFRKLSLEEKIIKARIALLARYPFFGYLALGLKIQEIEGLNPPTMATDGNHLFYDKNFVNELPPEHLEAILVHEVLHCILGHLWRKAERDHQKWNYATDYAINQIILDEGLKLPTNILFNPKFKGMSAEKIYNLLPDPKKISGNTLDSHEGWPSNQTGKNPANNPPDPTLKDNWQERVSRAAQMAKSMGKLPGQMENLVTDVLEPKLDWRTLLRDKIIRTARNDFRFFPPSKKYIWQGIYLPSVFGERLEIAVGIDTSGSVSEKEFQKFTAEIRGITEQYADYTLHLFFCDTRIHDYIVINPQDNFPKSFPKYNGGTSFIPVFEKIEEENLEISVLVYLTDGEGSFPQSEPKYPVIWALNKESYVPSWGDKIIIEA